MYEAQTQLRTKHYQSLYATVARQAEELGAVNFDQAVLGSLRADIEGGTQGAWHAVLVGGCAELQRLQRAQRQARRWSWSAIW